MINVENKKIETETGVRKKYDLEVRTFQFAKNVRDLVRVSPKKIEFLDDLKQVLRSSGSVGANYIEANESLSKKDFVMRVKICRKEAKETGYWLRLLELGDFALEDKKKTLINESQELTKIFGAILQRSQ